MKYMSFELKKNKAFISEEMLKMAKMFKSHKSIEEFLIAIDLQDFKYISTRRWLNPFFIYWFAETHKKICISIGIGIVLLNALAVIASLICFSSSIIIAFILALSPLITSCLCKILISDKLNLVQRALAQIAANDFNEYMREIMKMFSTIYPYHLYQQQKQFV